MKYLLVTSFLLFAFSGKAQSKFADSTFYIYVKPGDKLFQKLKYPRRMEFNYLCKCQRGDNLHFVYQDTNTQFIVDTLPKKFFSMAGFADLSNYPKPKYKVEDLYFAKIYIIEYLDNRYNYYEVKFFPNPGIE